VLMDENFIIELINRGEDPTLEFKVNLAVSQECPIDIKEDVWKKYMDGVWGELIRDICALANRNLGFTKRVSYLVIGVPDSFNKSRNNQINDTKNLKLDKDELLQKVNGAISPPLPNLNLYKVRIFEKEVTVIEIPPTPYLHETTKTLSVYAKPNSQKLELKKSYSKFTAFVRQGQEVEPIASGLREAIQKEKELSNLGVIENLKHEILSNLQLLILKRSGQILSIDDDCNLVRNGINPDLFHPTIDHKAANALINWVFLFGRIRILDVRFMNYVINSGFFMSYSSNIMNAERSKILEFMIILTSKINKLLTTDFQNLAPQILVELGSYLRDKDQSINPDYFHRAIGGLFELQDIIKLFSHIYAYLNGDKNAFDHIQLNPPSHINGMGEKIKAEILSLSECEEWAMQNTQKIKLR